MPSSPLGAEYVFALPYPGTNVNLVYVDWLVQLTLAQHRVYRC